MENYILKDTLFKTTNNREKFYAIYESENYDWTIGYTGDYKTDKEKGIMNLPNICIMMDAKNPYKHLSAIWNPTDALNDKNTKIQEPILAIRPGITEENIDDFYKIYKTAYQNMTDFRNMILPLYFPANITYMTLADMYQND